MSTHMARLKAVLAAYDEWRQDHIGDDDFGQALAAAGFFAHHPSMNPFTHLRLKIGSPESSVPILACDPEGALLTRHKPQRRISFCPVCLANVRATIRKLLGEWKQEADGAAYILPILPERRRAA